MGNGVESDEEARADLAINGAENVGSIDPRGEHRALLSGDLEPSLIPGTALELELTDLAALFEDRGQLGVELGEHLVDVLPHQLRQGVVLGLQNAAGAAAVPLVGHLHAKVEHGLNHGLGAASGGDRVFDDLGVHCLKMVTNRDAEGLF